MLDTNSKNKDLHPEGNDNEVTSKNRLQKDLPKTTEEVVAYTLYNRYDKNWLQLRNRCRLYIILWILLIVILLIFTFVERDISIQNGLLSGSELFSERKIRLNNELSFSISNHNYLSIQTAKGPTYNLTAYFLCARSSTPICGTQADYSRGGVVISTNISGDFSLVVTGRHKASNTITVEIEIDEGSSVYINNTVSQVYSSYQKTCNDTGQYYIRYSGYIDISTLMRVHNLVQISVEINKTCS